MYVKGNTLNTIERSVGVFGKFNVTNYIELGGNSWNFATTVPTTGNWKAGQRVFNTAPAVGQPKSWVNTVSGTPGTWVSEGNL
jgi:hypothetical protein